jgi:hypothetical protein
MAPAPRREGSAKGLRFHDRDKGETGPGAGTRRSARRSSITVRIGDKALRNAPPSVIDPESLPRFWVAPALITVAWLWTDRYSGRVYRTTTSGTTGGPGIARVRTYRDVIEEYATHPEAKSAAPDGGPCGRLTVGELGRLRVEAGRIVYVGKESNRLEEVEAGVLHDEPEFLNMYHDPRRDSWVKEVLPLLRGLPTAQLVRELGVSRSTVKRWKAGQSRPRRTTATPVVEAHQAGK